MPANRLILKLRRRLTVRTKTPKKENQLELASKSAWALYCYQMSYLLYLSDQIKDEDAMAATETARDRDLRRGLHINKNTTMDNIQIAQKQYISEWHDNFVSYIGGLMSLVVAMENHPFATDEDAKGFGQIKMLLHSREVLEIERNLAAANVKQEMLDKIEKLNKDLVDMAIEHLTTDAVVKEFLKKLSYYQIEQNKHLAEIRLKDMQLLK